MWKRSPGVVACISVLRFGDLVIFAMAHALHLNDGWRLPVLVIPFVHFAVACSFLSPMCPIRWCHFSVESIEVFSDLCRFSSSSVGCGSGLVVGVFFLIGSCPSGCWFVEGGSGLKGLDDVGAGPVVGESSFFAPDVSASVAFFVVFDAVPVVVA